MNARIMICIPCHNRKAVVEQCLPTVMEGMADGDQCHGYNDGSTDYEEESFLLGLGCDVAHCGKQHGIEVQRRLHFVDFDNSPQFSHLYLTDSDAIHDPFWRTYALRLQHQCAGAPICLYNTQAHVRLNGNTIEDNPASEVIWRRVAPGISYLLTREHCEKVLAALPHLPEHWNWDWTVPALLGNHFAVSRVSYVDHIGYGGMHHPENEGLDGGDRALFPTDFLVQKRKEVVAALSASQT